MIFMSVYLYLYAYFYPRIVFFIFPFCICAVSRQKVSERNEMLLYGPFFLQMQMQMQMSIYYLLFFRLIIFFCPHLLGVSD